MKIDLLFIGMTAVAIGVGIAAARNSERPGDPVHIEKPTPPGWQAYSLQWQTFSTGPQPGTGDIAAVRLPGPLSGEYLSMLTTTNWPGCTGNLTRQWVSMTMILDAGDVAPPVIFSSAWENEDWNSCPALPSVRLFFTSTPGKYDVADANAHPGNYWWCCTDFGSWTLTAVDDRGAYVEASFGDPGQWTDALGRSAADETNAFCNCVSNITQIGLSAGGNCFYDTGVALNAALTPETDEAGTAVLHITGIEVN
jgi:hypothetical protein